MGQPHARATPRSHLTAGRRGHHRPARPGLRQRRRHGRSPSAWLRARFGPDVVDHHTFVICCDGDLDGGDQPRSRLARRPPRPRPAGLRLRRQPHHDRRAHRARLLRRRRRRASTPTAGTPRTSARSPTTLDALEAALAAGDGGRGQAVADRAAQPHRLARPRTRRTPPRRTATRSATRRSRRPRRSSACPPTRRSGSPTTCSTCTGRCIPRARRERAAPGRHALRRVGTATRPRWDACSARARRCQGWEPEAADLRARRRRSRPAGRSTPASNATADVIPGLVAGGADLTGNTGMKLDGRRRPVRRAPRRRPGPLRHPRARAWAAVMTGMALHGGVLPVGGTFFVFSDYMRPSVRLAALSEAHVIYSWTHDSVGLGQDGPTHQPIEHLAAMRAMPGLRVIRPPTPTRRAQAWRIAVDSDGPDRPRPHPPGRSRCSRGRPTLAERRAAGRPTCSSRRRTPTTPDIVLVGTGVEVARLRRRPPSCWRPTGLTSPGRVDARLGAVRRSKTTTTSDRSCRRAYPRLAVEAASSFGWERYADDVVAHRPLRCVGPGRGGPGALRFHARQRGRPARQRPARPLPPSRCLTTRHPRSGRTPRRKRHDETARPLRRSRARAPGSTTSAATTSRDGRAGRLRGRGHPRRDLQPDDLRQGDRRQERLRRAVRRPARARKSVEDAYWELVIDRRRATRSRVLRPVHDASRRRATASSRSRSRRASPTTPAGPSTRRARPPRAHRPSPTCS